MSEQELFKTTLMGGYDKDDVHQQLQEMQDKTEEEKRELQKIIEEKDAKISQLQKRIELKDAHQERVEEEIKEKYQKYIDNYEQIAKLQYDAQVKSDAMMADTKKKCEEMLTEARRQSQSQLESVQKEVDEKLRDGKKKYVAVQEELNQIVELINQAQKRFMASYKEVHHIISEMPSSLRDMEEENEEEEINIAADQRFVSHMDDIFGDDE